jgi:propionate CoA-transferase
MGRPKFVTAPEAVQHIKTGDTLGSSGFIGMGHAEEITYELEKRFLSTGEPHSLTVTWGSSQSDTRNMVGCNRFAHEGFIKRALVGHMGMQFDLSRMVLENKFEAYNIPQGVLMHIIRAQAGRKPCVITPIGLGTYIDPRETGGKLNSITIENGPDFVSVIEIDGKEYLMYKTFPIDVAIIRGTTADEHGNITMEKEGIILEAYSMAAAARASGGIVIAQVERIAKVGTLHPQMVRVPGILVDYIVKCSEPLKFHRQSYTNYYEPSLSGECKIPLAAIPSLPLNERKIISRRAALELIPDAVINLGVGIPSEVGNVAAEEGLIEHMTLTVEPGPIGGVPCAALEFGCAYNPEALIEHSFQFDLYDGGGLDIAILGLAEVDSAGNVNVSKFGPRVYGAGGFVNITQNTGTVIFVGTLTTGGLKTAIIDRKLHIIKEGSSKKFVSTVSHKTFSGDQARIRKQKVLYITERAVFELRQEGIYLIEIAPGINIDSQILAHLDFSPVVSSDLKQMDERIFSENIMGIYDEIMIKDTN